jgi:EAL domain-containing protein (putative c-di-GMP-specific phosphodiesterase class I)
MLDQVLRQMQAWQRGGQSGDVSLTLSLSVLLDQHFPDLIDVLLRQYDVGAERLMLEVAEEAVMHQPEPAARAIKRLAGTGVRVVLCGMGARHTCLELVSCLPLSELKIDRAVIARLHGAHGPAMVGAILGLSRGLGLGLVADGVEDRRTREVLRTLGCRLMQGGYLCPPLTAPEVGPWLRAEGRTTCRTGPEPLRTALASMGIGVQMERQQAGIVRDRDDVLVEERRAKHVRGTLAFRVDEVPYRVRVHQSFSFRNELKVRCQPRTRVRQYGAQAPRLSTPSPP